VSFLLIVNLIRFIFLIPININFLKSKIYLFFLVYSFYGFAQNASTYHKIFGEHDGFSIDIVRAMNFDKDGFLWLGGENLENRKIVSSDRAIFLQRFNGTTFHKIQLPKLDKKILKISQIYKRNDGQFYLKLDVTSYEQRLILFNPVSMEFQKMNASELLGNAISRIFKIKEEAHVLVQNDKEILLCKIHSNLDISVILTLTYKKDIVNLFTRFIPFKDFFLLTNDHLSVVAYNWQGEEIKEFPKLKSNKKVFTWIDEVFKKDDITYIFLYNDAQLYYVDEENIEIIPVGKTKKTTIKSEQLLVYNDDFKNNLILSSQEKKISIHSYVQGGFKKIIKDFNFKNGRAINSISNNINEGFWIATDDRELHYFKLPSQKVKTFLDDKSIRAIQELNEDEFVVATEGDGWFSVNIKNEKVKRYQVLENGKALLPYSSRNIIRDGNDIWSNGLEKIFKKDIVTSEIKSWKNIWVRCMQKLNDSILVYGTENQGLYEFNTNTKKYQAIVKLDSLFFYDIAVHNNIIAGATDKGAFFYNLENKKSELLTVKNGLPDDFFLMTDFDSDYGFLFGSRTGKVVSFNHKSKKFTTLYDDELNAGIATIIRDSNNWWIHTFKGFVHFNTENKKATRFGIVDGFSNNEANRYSALKTKEGVLVGTIKGLNYFNPTDLKEKKNTSELVLLGIRKYDKTLKKYIEILDRKKISKQKSITIPSENRNLELDFSITNNSVVLQHNYRYKLNNEDWISLRNQQTIRLANLAAGTYVLEIEALDFSNKKIAKSLLLEINSKKFFYKTWWFYLVLSLFSISFLVWFLRLAKEKSKMQENFSQDLLHSQEEERTRIARELHDSVGQQLTLIKRKTQNLEEDELTEMANNALEEVRSISRGLYPALLKQLGLTESVELLINEYDEETDLFFSVDIENFNAYFTESTSLNYYRLIQECLTNIVKHANAKSVSITIKREGSLIQTIITDNGKGFEVNDSVKKNSLGLKTIFERIRIMNGKISIDSKINNGTSFLFSIPVKNES
jgi:signal transduction histidine kinase